MFKANFPLFHFKEYFYGLAFIKNLFVTYGTLLKFYNCCNGAIYSLLLILNYGDALSELKFKKSYAVYILEKYIHLLQFAKYIMLRSLLKYVLKGFEKVLRYYVIFKTQFYVHEFSWELSLNQ